MYEWLLFAGDSPYGTWQAGEVVGLHDQLGELLEEANLLRQLLQLVLLQVQDAQLLEVAQVGWQPLQTPHSYVAATIRVEY
jgi:hypothetical protein